MKKHTLLSLLFVGLILSSSVLFLINFRWSWKPMHTVNALVLVQVPHHHQVHPTTVKIGKVCKTENAFVTLKNAMIYTHLILAMMMANVPVLTIYVKVDFVMNNLTLDNVSNAFKIT